MYEAINQYVSRCHTFAPDELLLFNELLRVRKAGKRQLLLREGEICDFEAYLVKGCTKTYYIDHNGFEVIWQFAVEDWWVSDIAAFHSQTPSRFFIETLEPCELLTLSLPDKEKLLDAVPKFERVFRLMVQRHLAATQNRLIDQMTHQAQERYLTFLAQYPQIAHRVPQHQIAAYLGISPEFLSKIRQKIAKR